MSTRRARIKAVTSLPPRRKNTETADNSTKQIPPKEITEKITRSPRTPKINTASNQEQNLTPHVKSTFDPPTHTTPGKVIKTPNVHNRTTPRRFTTSNESPQREPASPLPIIEKTLSNANYAIKNNVGNVFASPFQRDSPKQTFVSPTVPSPKIKNSDQRPTTPQKNIPTPVAQKINENNELQIAENIISNISHNRESKKSHKENDNSLNIAENTNDEAMDGIVPLQPAGILHKPIDLLKSEIISENAEVLFDPIVPLPSPSKVRPKLRPAPRLGPHRRSSIQGSASESEDESRRNLHGSGTSRQRHDSHTSHSTHQSLQNRDVSRVRNDSVCSTVSQATTQPLPPGSPVKEKQINKAKRQDMTCRRMVTMRRRRENIKRDALTMYDLIFYNPTSNPIVPDEDEMNIKEANVKEELERTKKEEVIEPEPIKDKAAPVPQIKLGPQGEIILDEESLVIKQTNSGRAVSSVVHEGKWSGGTGYKYKRGPRTAEWSAAETVRFYRALAAIGTDFTLMAPLFPDRTRKELKLKFKKEEKINGAQVDKALRAKVPWDVLKLKDEFKQERIDATKRAERERERLLEEKRAQRERIKAARDLRVRPSRGSKALESTMLPGMNMQNTDAMTAGDIIDRMKNNKQCPRKRKSKLPTSIETANNFATLTPLNKVTNNQNTVTEPDITTFSKITTPNLQIKTPEILNGIPQIPPNIETGSLVVLTVNDPSSPAKKMLQTYIAHDSGRLTPVALPTTLLNSVVGYMKKNIPKGSMSSPQILSPSSITSHDSRTSTTPSGFAVLPSPTKRQRHNSFTITQL